ncbi:hypothetical protein GQ43DRAFT_144690 [Delitschia confertaspora ATCC 74209]|uniref:Glutamyl-tRNA amidotransferase complex subunit Gta3 domain-containing protein n=1 Tax=Delitschia confertaspora ATCC 74209 TaxID=1513339 RepID=A0A9P4MPY7_9PLEO|nr:hypothetical protein GQ43DRAFT_144690 [Delitschia confertaspora ATCC 74209]
MVSKCSLSCSRALPLLRSFRSDRRSSLPLRIRPTSSYSTETDTKNFQEISQLFSKPAWSVESLLPPKTAPLSAPQITSSQLHHLLRLSALPLPENSDEESRMLETLSAQLHFVGEIQQVDTTGVTPLPAIRDETVAAEESQVITLEGLRDALGQEEVVGKHYKRIKRKSGSVDAKDVDGWDVLGQAERKVGRYFVVESERS